MALEGYNFDCVEGDWVRLMEIIDELGNRILDTPNSFSDFFTSGTALVFDVGTFASGDANPSIATGETIWLTAGSTNITDIDDGSTGRVIIILAESTIRLDHGVHLWLSGNVHYNMIAGDSIMLVQKADTFWYEVARSGEFNVTTINATGNITTDSDVSGNNLSATLDVSGATGTFSGAVGVGSLNAGSGAIGTTGDVSGTNVTASAILGGATLSISGAATVGSLDAGSGTIETTGGILTGQYIGLSGEPQLIGLTSGQVDINGDLAVTGLYKMVTTTSTTGQFCQAGDRLLHSFGSENVFFGKNAGNFTTSGTGRNVGIGQSTLISLTTGNENLAIGRSAMLACDTGLLNVAVGGSALQSLTDGNSNMAIGRSALILITTGAQNVAIGRNAGVGLGTSSSNNVLIGSFAGGASSITASGNVFIGNEAGRDETGSNTFMIDNEDAASEVLSREHALLYGLFSAHASGPWLSVNGGFQVGNSTANRDMNVTGNVRIGDTTVPTDALEVNGVTVLGDGGATNYTAISAAGVITQAGTASASLGALTATSVDAGSGTIQTTGSGSFGAISGSSLNAGSGTITTTGANNGATGVYTGKFTVGSFGDTSPATLDTTTTPSVANGTCFTVPGSANDITNFDGGFSGQVIFLRASGTRTISETANIKCDASGVGITLNNEDGASFMRIGTVWYMVSRRDN